MKNKTDIFTLHEEVKAELKKIPSVVTVGIGLKEVKGELTEQVVFRVYVKEKKELSQLDPQQVIPKTIKGFETDVLRYFETGKSSTGGTRPLLGGTGVSSVINNAGLLEPSSGTLGCIAKIRGATTKVILSNEHVMNHTSPLGSPNKVYQPKYSSCLGFVCNEVGQTTRGKKENVSFNNGSLTTNYYTDCATASINDGIGASHQVAVIGSIARTRDISTLAINNLNPYRVKKMGATTGFTEGIVEDVAFDEAVDPPDIPELRRIVVRPNPGVQWEETYQVPSDQKTATIDAFKSEPHVKVTDLGGNRLKFKVMVFSKAGDSGSVVVNNSNEAVGLHFAMSVRRIRVENNAAGEWVNIPLGKGLACHIGPVLEQMNIEIPAGTTPSSGMPMLVPGTPLKTEFNEEETSLNQAMDDLEVELRQSPNGKLLIRLLQDQLPEIIQLVHHRRPVKFTWNKYKGPAFINTLLNGIRRRHHPLPKVIDGVYLNTLLSKMHEVLKKEGSQPLNTRLEQVSGYVYQLAACQTMAEMLQRVKNEPFAA